MTLTLASCTGMRHCDDDAAPAQPQNQAMQRLKTYLVEDSPVIRDSLIATLQDLTPVQVVGFAVDERSALRWLENPEHEADLVIVDIFLKAGSGLIVLQACALWQPRRTLVVLSNYATVDIRQRCLALGADRVFDKSTEIEALIDYCGQHARTATLRHPPANGSDQAAP